MLGTLNRTKKALRLGLCVFLLAARHTGLEAAGTFRVNDYGAVPNDANDDAPAIYSAINAAIAAGTNSVVQFGSGVYRVSNSNALYVNGANGLTIEGAGFDTELLVPTPGVQAIRVRNSANVVLRNFTMDYAPPPFSQGVIVGINRSAWTFDLQIDPGFLSPLAGWFASNPSADKWGMVFDPTQRKLKEGVYDVVSPSGWTQVSPGVFRASGSSYWLSACSVGDRFVQIARPALYAIYWESVTGGALQNVRIHASPGLTVAMVACTGMTVDNLQVAYRAGTTRLLTCNADGVHCQRNRGPLSVQNSLFEGMADDGVAIYTLPAVVTQVISSSTIRVSGGAGINVGDRLQIFDPATGNIRDTVTATASSAGSGTGQVSFSPPVDGIIAGTTSSNADTVSNLSACGEGSVIRNNAFRNPRRYAINQKGGNALIEDNTIDHVGGWGIVVGNEPSWPEGPVPYGITIRGNTITGVGRTTPWYGWDSTGAAIRVGGWGLYGLSQEPVVKDITIENNTIIDPPGAGIYLGAVQGADLVDNSISAALSDTAARYAGAVILDSCNGVRVDGLTVDDPRPETIAGLHILPSVWPGISGVSWSGLTMAINAASVPVLDERVPVLSRAKPGWQAYE